MKTIKLLTLVLVVQICLFYPRQVFARGGGGCLAEGTLIDTPSGSVPIEQIRKGDSILTWNGERFESGKAVAHIKVSSEELITLTILNNSGLITELIVTPEHPISIAAGIYKEARIIKQNSTVLLRNREGTQTGIVQRVLVQKTEKAAYNLLVDKNGTFVANNVILHNKGCFLPNTSILLADGSTTKNIEDIQKGDKVLAFQKDGAIVSTVVNSIITTESESFFEVKTDSILLKVTPEHPFYVGQGTFKTIQSLKTGDSIFAFDGLGLSSQIIRSIKLIKQKVRVYNLQTDSPHTFLANGVAVHNKGGGCLAEGSLIDTPSGKKAIEQIKIGDPVITWNGVNFELGRVAAHLRVAPKELLKLEILPANNASTTTLIVTPEHPISVENGVYQEAGTIKEGMKITLRNSTGIETGFVKQIETRQLVKSAYNLLVDKNGTFIANDLIVHNKGCFLPNTPILLANGSSKNIEEIQTGERVIAFQKDGSVVSTTVNNIIIVEAESYFELQTETVLLRVTPEHPFYVGQGKFRTIQSLKIGDSIFAYNGTGLAPQIIKSIKSIDQKVRVYNLQTDEPHTFLANGIAVHNKGGGGYHGHYSGRSGSSKTWDKKNLVIMLIFVLAVIAFSCWRDREGEESQDLDYLFSRRDIIPKAEATKKLLDFIAQNDPPWAEPTLVQHVSTVFLKLQNCWQKRDYSALQGDLIGYLFEQHQKQIAGLRRNHEINVLIGLEVLKIDIVNVRYTHKTENREFTALITARAKDIYLDDRTQQQIRGDYSVKTFQEFWTFQLVSNKWLLRDIRQTGESSVLKEENFFEQFTDQQIEQATGAAVTQTGAPAPWLSKDATKKETRTERLLNFLCETDKLWQKQSMLNLARSVCTDLYMTMETQNISSDFESKLAPDLLEQLKKQLDLWRKTNTSAQHRNFCVREVDIVLVRNFSDNSKDEFVARVFGHAQSIIISKGRETRHDEDVTPFEDFMIFGRFSNTWRLKELLESAEGESLLKQENFDEDTTPQMMQWYYSKKRTV